LEIFVDNFQRTNWSCIHQDTTEEQMGWLQKGLEDIDEAHSETSVGWSNKLGTISASDEWWKEKI
jgi:hypothetical protein